MRSHRLRLAQVLCRPLPPPLALRLGDRIYPESIGREEARAFSVRTRSGSTFRGRTDDRHAVTVAVHGYSGEWRNWVIAAAVCAPGDVLVEAGANVGTDTVAYADVVGPAGRVVAFEPLPGNLEQLRVATAAQANVTLLPYAVSDEVGKVRFWRPPHEQNAGMARILAPGEELDAIDVQRVTLDALEDDLGPARLIAVDIEGAEVALLRGASAYLARHRPVIITEASRAHLARQGESLDTLLSTLAHLGYRACRVTRGGLVGIGRAQDAPDQSNWLALHHDDPTDLDRVRRLLRRAAVAPCVPRLSPLYVSRHPRVGPP